MQQEFFQLVWWFTSYRNGERQDDGYEYKTIITFLCNKNIPLGTPSFSHFAEHTFFFNFETSLACSPEPVQCRIAEPGNVTYNLEPLIKKKGVHWFYTNLPSFDDTYLMINNFDLMIWCDDSMLHSFYVSPLQWK